MAVYVDNKGDAYRLVLMRVLDVYEDRPEVGGMKVPAELLFLDNDDVCEISEEQGKDRFVTAFVPISVFGSAPKGGK